MEILHAYASSETYETFSWSDFDQAFSSLFEVPEVTVTTEESTGPQQDNTLVTVYFLLILSLYAKVLSCKFI